MIHVLHAIGEMGTGGAESLVVEMVRGGPAVGWRSSVASAGGPREDDAVALGAAEVYRVPLSRRRPLGVAKAAAATRRAISAAQPDVIIAHNIGVSAAVALARWTGGRRVPVVSVFHGVARQEYRAAALVLNVSRPHAVVAVSEAIANQLVSAGLRRAPSVIPNAVTAPALPPQSDARDALGLPGDAPIAICAARLVEQKRHDVLLRAWAQLPEGCLLLVAGDGPLRGELEKLSAELGIQHRVHFLGNRTDVPVLLAAADVATLASDWEGLPIFLLEAMAAGRPVVATDVDGIAELLRDGGGLLVPPRSPDELARALEQLLTDPAQRSTASAAGLQTIAGHYDPGRMMRRYDDLIRSSALRSSRNAPTEAP